MSLFKLMVLFIFIFLPTQRVPDESQKLVLFGAGCFWNLEYFFGKLDGVISTECVYTNSDTEAVLLTYDPSRINLEQLTEKYFNFHDPRMSYRSRYVPVIQCSNFEDLDVVKDYLRRCELAGLKHKTAISLLKQFRSAEKMHQNWYENKGTFPKCSVSGKF